MRRLLLTIPTLLLVLAIAAPALAQDDRRARELYENGALLYEEGDYENAVVAWKQAHEISERPLLLYNIANALERIGEWAEAFDYLNQYRAFAKADERDALDRRMRSIERRLEVRKEEEAAEARRAGSGDPAGGGSNPSGGNDLTPTSRGTAAASGPNPGGVILLGAGLGSVAVGGVFGGLALSERQDAAALCSTGDPVLCPDTAGDSLENDRAYSIASDITMIAGGAIAVAGVVVLIADAASGNKKATSFRIIPSAGPEGGSVTLVARW